ncbi:type II toxin-antitoxin system VapC family toxin [Piscinibacter koreensis]|uniref:Ribonuclease VapC n=1 Tax=Piscinibacter koreensis TaxID=2742824 RepID=A0A7Y6TY56_9BURK|nr:type II toxin-antitoxin system VapC family toxin [Schlegelella koreensis]NUZ07849.1 type II toxin-antitoxin system VapC family toxin [Schlegelella koreensis]
MTVVVDSSYALACVLPDEPTPTSISDVFGDALLVPFIWPLEVANAIRSAVRSRRFDRDDAAAFIAEVASLDARVAAPWHDDAARYLELALVHDLSAYDAIYIDLCLGERVPLATRDAKLARAAERVGIRTLT